jgi:hypothetical protein
MSLLARSLLNIESANFINPHGSIHTTDMEITNLEINILYFICDPDSGQSRFGRIDSKAIFDEFSDIPDGIVETVIDKMSSDQLINMDAAHSTIEITPTGVNRLQSSLACRIHHFGRCGCGRSI